MAPPNTAAAATAAATAAAAAAGVCPRVDHQHTRVIPPPRTGGTGACAYDLQKPLPLQAEEDQVH